MVANKKLILPRILFYTRIVILISLIFSLIFYDKYLKITELKYELQSIGRNSKELQAEILDLYKRCNPMKPRIFIIFSRKHEKALQEVNKKFENLLLV